MRQASSIKTDLPFTTFSIEADRDYLLARHISFLGSGFHSRAGYLGQQACEKYMKAISVQGSGEYLEAHALLKLAKFCEKVDSFFADNNTKEILQTFDYFEQVGRYGAAANFDPLAKHTTAMKTKGVMIWREEYLQDLDAFVFKARSLLDYRRAKFSDSLRAILDRNRKDILTATGQGRTPLRVILTKNNRHFCA
jgi:HEPN domain-containing protein